MSRLGLVRQAFAALIVSADVKRLWNVYACASFSWVSLELEEASYLEWLQFPAKTYSMSFCLFRNLLLATLGTSPFWGNWQSFLSMVMVNRDGFGKRSLWDC